MNSQTPSFPDLIEPDCRLHWQMSTCERFALAGLLQRLRPELSLEIGTYMGGSLQALAKYSHRVISIDIDPQVAVKLSPLFPNTDFRSGDSATLLPDLIRDINLGPTSPAFVLIDGDHSREGVRRDIEALLGLKPRQQTVVILHDSFNPECRAGMRAANWAACPNVHEVELDYVPGIFHEKAYDTAEARTMWGGLACAILEPFPRTHELVMRECQRGLFETVLKNSSHAPRRRFQLVRNLLRKLSEI
jgi:hypothetical protein